MKIEKHFMKEALKEARKAYAKGEVPVGAVLVKKDKIIGRGHNRCEELKDSTAHAEIMAIRIAAEQLGTWRLTDTILYVTLEPCPMCAGAIVNSRIYGLVYGTYDLKAGAVSSLMNLVQDNRLNHQVKVADGIMQEEASELLKKFFANLR